ncbi:MAG: hypothetical protein LBT37_00155 [Lactobacillaceae bacterium]|jgi:mannosyltransferase OCH1-like enzyme|nr:hypothetical protein [Lactobacillaceae bacterium]
MIPKQIYYIWFGNNPKPQAVLDCIHSWETFAPDYEIVEVNESNFDLEVDAFIHEAYDAKKWAFASDMARLKVLNEKGGIYFDTDLELIKPIADVLNNQKSVWTLEAADAIDVGQMIAVAPHDQHVGALLEIYQGMHFDVNKQKYLIITKIVTKYFLQHGFIKRNRTQVLPDALILNSNFFAPYHWWGGGHITAETHGIHHYSGTWQDAHNPIFGRIKWILLYLRQTLRNRK